MASHTLKLQKTFSKKSPKIFDLAIIGAGPAGISSALQAKKEGLSFIIFEKAKIGGQINIADCIENYAGIIKPTSGKNLAKLFKKQLLLQKIKINLSEILSVRHHKSLFELKNLSETFYSKSVIVANGLVPKKLSIKGEDKISKKKIFSYIEPSHICSCDKNLLVIGSGDSAFDQAISFYKLKKNVTIAMKHKKPKCNQSLIKKIGDTNVKILSEHIIESIKEKNNKLLTYFKNNKSLSFDSIIVCIGKQQSFPFLNKKLVDKKPKNLFFAGDCKGNLSRYIANACSDGINAVAEITSTLRNK